MGDVDETHPSAFRNVELRGVVRFNEHGFATICGAYVWPDFPPSGSSGENFRVVDEFKPDAVWDETHQRLGVA